jgi:RimJ/RimL family protein N-acetyltransferase
VILQEIRFNNPQDGNRLAEAAGTGFNPVTDIVIARVKGHELYGGIVYTGYTGPFGSIAAHFAGVRRDWMSLELIWVCFDYAFNQLQARKIIGLIPDNNAKSLRLARHLGFVVEHTIKDALPNGDMYLVSMYRTACRFIQPEQLPDGPV